VGGGVVGDCFLSFFNYFLLLFFSKVLCASDLFLKFDLLLLGTPSFLFIFSNARPGLIRFIFVSAFSGLSDHNVSSFSRFFHDELIIDILT